MNSNAANSTNKPSKRGRNYVNTLVYAAVFVALSAVLKVAFEIYFTPQIRFNFSSVPIMMAGIFLGPLWGFAVGVIADLLNFMLRGGGVMHLGFTLTSALTGFIPGIVFYWVKKRRKEPNFSMLNVINFIILIAGMVFLLWSGGIVAIENGALYMNGEVVQWYVFGLLLAVLVLYSLSLVWLLRKKESANTPIPATKILFVVTGVSVICGLVLNTIFLADLYGMTVFALLPMRLVKEIISIPILSFVCFILSNAFVKISFKNIKSN